MIKIRHNITVNRPVEEVFHFLTDAGNVFKYSRSVESLRQITKGPIGLGTRFEIISKFMGRHIPTTLEVTAFEPNHLLASKSVSGPFQLLSSTTFASNGENTRVEFESEVVPTGLWKLMEPVLPSIIRSSSQKEYRTLHRLLSSSMKREDPGADIIEVSRTVVVVED